MDKEAFKYFAADWQRLVFSGCIPKNLRLTGNRSIRMQVGKAIDDSGLFCPEIEPNNLFKIL